MFMFFFSICFTLFNVYEYENYFKSETKQFYFIQITKFKNNI
jgi:hypothetical protein